MGQRARTQTRTTAGAPPDRAPRAAVPATRTLASAVGNRAFAALVARAPAAPALDLDEQLVDAVTHLIWRVRSSDWTPPVPPAGMSREHAAALMQLWTALTGERDAGGSRGSTDAATRLVALDAALAKLNPVFRRFAQERGPEGKTWVAAQLEAPLESFRASIYRQEAGEIVSAATSRGLARGPRQLSAEGQLRESIAAANKLVAELVDDVNNYAGDALDDAVVQAELPGGMKTALALTHAQGVLDGLDALLAATDPAERAKIAAKLERQGFIPKATGISEIVTLGGKGLEGLSSILGPITAGVLRMRGQVQQADEILKLSAKATAGLADFLSFVQIAHGTLVLFDPVSTADEKADAVVEITLGGIGVAKFLGAISGTAAGAASLSITATWFMFKTSMKMGADFLTAAIQIDLNEALKAMEKRGDALARQLMQVEAYAALTQARRSQVGGRGGAAAVRGYESALKGSLRPLQEAIANAWNDCARSQRHSQMPGHYRAIRRPFATPQMEELVRGAMEPGAAPDLVIIAGQTVLTKMKELFDDLPALTTDVFTEYKEDRGIIEKKKAGGAAVP